jgi:hypothetical protein
MTLDKCLMLVGAIAGAAGTGLLYRGSFSFIQPGGFFLGEDTLAKVKARNTKLGRLQRTGLVFLMLSFLFQAAALFV